MSEVPVLAHALGARDDLPIPAWLFMWGASLVLIVSFAVLAIAWREPRLQEDRRKPLPERLSAVLTGRGMEFFAGALGVTLLIATIYTGLEGTAVPDQNFAFTFVFVTFWLGTVVLTFLFGDVFTALNPWRAIARAAAAGFRAVAGQSAPAPLSYPERLGHWPAVAGLLGFAFLELIYGPGTRTGLTPNDVAIAAILYSAITFVAVALYGIEEWFEKGETFSVYFRMFSKLSLLTYEEGRLQRRHPLSGVSSWGQVPGSLALVVVAIGITSFDGSQEGTFADPIRDTFDALRDTGLSSVASLRITSTSWMLLVCAGVALIYLLGVRGMRTVPGAPPFADLRRGFAHTLIPIALAYLVAHYFSYFSFQVQAQFTYLLSDPLGEGSDFFGTAGTPINFFIGSNGIWYVQVGSLVAGHVAALVLAHDKAVTTFKDYRLASSSQYWMLAVMVAFTTFGLILLSQANA